MENRPRILHVIDSFQIGGTENQCVQLIKSLNKELFDIRLLTLNSSGPLSTVVRDARIPLNEIRISCALYYPQSLLQIMRMVAFMRQQKFQIVQTYGLYSNIPGIFAAKVARVPIVIGGKRELNQDWSRAKIGLEMFLLKKCNSVVVNARKVKDYLAESEGVPASLVTVINNGIEVGLYEKIRQENQLQLVNNSPIIAMIANFRSEKDHMTFVEAASIVSKKMPEVSFALVGTGETEENIQQYVQKLGLSNKLIFYGSKTGTELLNLFKNFSITVLASRTEGMPNAIIESMALGIPVIANPAGGIVELINDGRTGYFFPYKRPDLLAEKIIFLLENKDIAKKITLNSIDQVKKVFSMKQMASKFEFLYRHCINTINT